MSTGNGTDEQANISPADDEMEPVIGEVPEEASKEVIGEATGEVNGQLNGHIDGVGEIRAVNINHEMQTAYLDYAMSVIVSRALPDVRDGLKPVHRRILYSMYHDLGLTADKSHKKSARIVGEVLGKYHPHGDTAVYDAMVRMAQEFSLRYPLVDGQGNFGSIDGDNAAAMRYTEARLARISNLVLDDLDKDTVEWHDNFDNTLREPDVLPAALPNLLINGSSGIAVGMATNIPPHNLSEVVDALAYVIDNFHKVDEITVEELMRFIKGPDFPTGGILYRYREDSKGDESTDAIAQGYAVGKSRLILQAKAHFEEMSRNRSRIVITELPYQTNKTALLERIASLARDGKLEGITDLRDESDRTGMRITVEMTRTVEPKQMLERLFKYTPLQQTFGMQMLALVEDEPRTLGLKRILQLFINHRQEIIRRRSEYDLAKAKARAHILEGLIRALDILDEVIATIRRSQNVETARNNLVKNFQFTEIQAQAILDMQLRRLAALERRKLQDEYKELQKLIAHLEDLLAHPKKMLAVIKADLLQIKETYGDARRTQIVERTKGTLTSTDLLPQQDVWVSVSRNGNLRRQDVSTVGKTTARQMGKGADLALLTANTRDFLYLFGKDGQCRRLSIHEIPQDGSSRHAADYTEFTRRDVITAAIALPRDVVDAGGYLFMVTAQGMVKRVTLADFATAVHADPIVMGVDPRDRLCWVLQTTGAQEIIFVSQNGQSIRISEADVRSMGLAAGGVGGMKLKKEDEIIFAGVVDPAGELLTITGKGYAKRTPMEEYSTQGRNGGGIVTHKPTARTAPVAAALILASSALLQAADEWLVLTLSQGGPHALTLDEIPQMGRGVQGKQVTPAGLGDTVVQNISHLKLPRGASLPNGTEPGNGEDGAAASSGQANGKTKPAASTVQARAKRQAAASRKTTASPKSRSKAARSTPKGKGATTSATTRAAAPTQASASKTVKAAKPSQVASKKALASKPTPTAKSGRKRPQAAVEASDKSTQKKPAAPISPSKRKAVKSKTVDAKIVDAKIAKDKTVKSKATERKTAKTDAAKLQAAPKAAKSVKSTGKDATRKDATGSATSTPKRKAASTAGSKPATSRTTASRTTASKTTASKTAVSKAKTPKPRTTKKVPAQTAAAKPAVSQKRSSSKRAAKPQAAQASPVESATGKATKASPAAKRATAKTAKTPAVASTKKRAKATNTKQNQPQPPPVTSAKTKAAPTKQAKSKASSRPPQSTSKPVASGKNTKSDAAKSSRPKVAIVASVTQSQASQAKGAAQKK